MPDEDDRPRDGHSAADASWSHPVVPDDLSSLAADIAAYHREVRAERRRQRLRHLLGHRRTLPLVIMALALVVAAIVGSLLTFMTRGAVDHPLPAAALAIDPSAAPGQVGGLLPTANLAPAGTTGVSVVSPQASALRPAVLALVEPDCNCTQTLDRLGGAAWGVDLPLDLVVSAPNDSFAPAYEQDGHGGPVNVFFDRVGSLASAIGAHGVTVVVVAPNGVIQAEQPAVTSTYIRTSLSATLQSMSVADRATG